MSRLFLTADYHFGHAMIAKYTERPWFKKYRPDFATDADAIACATEMDAGLISFANERVKPEDRVIHVGDFMNRGRAAGVPGLRKYWQDYIKALNGYWTLLKGNHDAQNKVKVVGEYLFFEHAGKKIFASHYPTDSDHHDPALIDYVHNYTDFAVVGHVHTSWQVKRVPVSHGRPTYLNINVGIDVWNYRPVTADEVVALASKEL